MSDTHAIDDLDKFDPAETPIGAALAAELAGDDRGEQAEAA